MADLIALMRRLLDLAVTIWILAGRDGQRERYVLFLPLSIVSPQSPVLDCIVLLPPPLQIPLLRSLAVVRAAFFH
jgi:hypothetical protein